MDDYPYSDETEATYENFIAVCPECTHRNVFNRASDFESFDPIAFNTVVCQNVDCVRRFNIKDDRINPGHQAVLFDCHGLLKDKHYMQAVLAITQSYEMLFSHYLRVELLYRPFMREGTDNLDVLNRLGARLYRTVRMFTFEPMRRLFLAVAIRPEGFRSLPESEAWLSTVPRSWNKIPIVGPEQIDAVSNTEVRDLLAELASVKIHVLRNRVVHKEGYRPKRCQAEEALSQARRVVHRLTTLLGVQGDADWYLNQPGR